MWITKKENMDVLKSMLTISKALESILQVLSEYHRLSDCVCVCLKPMMNLDITEGDHRQYEIHTYL